MLCELIKKLARVKKYPMVVKCKNCAWSDNSIMGIDDIYCRKHMNWVDKEGFCSHGVRGDKNDR
jgi:hypothetical protein